VTNQNSCNPQTATLNNTFIVAALNQAAIRSNQRNVNFNVPDT